MPRTLFRTYLPATVSLTAALALQPSGAQAGFDAELIKAHISVLAHDSLEGRKVGTESERKAAAYIAGQFAEIGLDPAGDPGAYLQHFEFTSEIRDGANNALAIDGRALQLDDDFQPLISSKVGDFRFEGLVYVGYGIEHDSLDHHDYQDKDVAGKAVLISRSSPDGDDPHGPYYNYSSLDAKVAEALQHDAAGVFFFTPEGDDDVLEGGPVKRVVPMKDIPIVFLKRTVFDDTHPTPEALAQATFELTIDLERVKDTAMNVVGTLTGGGAAANERIVVVGAHFDHLGWGGKGSGSKYLGEEPQIHNGADDNASGTAGMIEMARHFAEIKDDLNYSLLFIGFTGEEFGILGSSHFVKNPTIDLENVDFMVNMDMIGRLDTAKGLMTMGSGSSPTFQEYFDAYKENFENGKYSDSLKILVKESGVGPSDHSAFYNSDIPVLFFFTGQHEDYHKPTDDTEGIDFAAETKVLDFVAARIEQFASEPEKLVFQKTKNDAPGKSPRFTVTLGVMPDYLWEEKGLRIDGVTEGGPADLAGVHKGDIVVQLGEYEVHDIYAYMAGLAHFRKGDSTTVVVEREGERIEMPLVF
ncbi:MAG TPA: M28 family peptidase [candidate division Zixibacteria bacterium]|nr:M28 family peptidase [candidate division Zixibacteria bacterium]